MQKLIIFQQLYSVFLNKFHLHLMQFQFNIKFSISPLLVNFTIPLCNVLDDEKEKHHFLRDVATFLGKPTRTDDRRNNIKNSDIASVM